MPDRRAHRSAQPAQLLLLCFILINGGIFVSGEFLHSDGLDFTAGPPMQFGEEVVSYCIYNLPIPFFDNHWWPYNWFYDVKNNLKSAYEACLAELRKQAVSIRRLEDLSETQADAIKELQEVVSQQTTAIGKMEIILSQSNMTGNFLELPSSVNGTLSKIPRYMVMEYSTCMIFSSCRLQRCAKGWWPTKPP